MLCHLVIDLSKGLCTRSDDRTKLVQRYYYMVKRECIRTGKFNDRVCVGFMGI